MLQSENVVDSLNNMQPKNKEAGSSRILNTWIAQAERQIGADAGRLGWLVASTIVAAKLQQVTDESKQPIFLLKGGTLLQHLIPEHSRATKDLDGLLRADLEVFMAALDIELCKPWEYLSFHRGPVKEISVPHKSINPRRFGVTISIKGVIWRTIQVEISPPEGNAGNFIEKIASPRLDGLGLPSPDDLACLSMGYQIAQKLHAVSDAHDPPGAINDRVRDVVDLLLLRELIHEVNGPEYQSIERASIDTFETRAQEAKQNSTPARNWPPTIVANPHWRDEFTTLSKSVGITHTLEEATEVLNNWVIEISQSH